jgi:hypothetical protein
VRKEIRGRVKEKRGRKKRREGKRQVKEEKRCKRKRIIRRGGESRGQ